METLKERIKYLEDAKKRFINQLAGAKEDIIELPKIIIEIEDKIKSLEEES